MPGPNDRNHAGYLLNVPMPVAPAGVDFPRLREAVRRAGILQLETWGRLADGEAVNRLTGAYLAGLRTEDSFQYPFDKDRLAVGVFNNARHAAAIEYGHPPYNLASRIRWGRTPKSRWSKRQGRWYILIPFRHYTPARAGEGASVGREKASMPKAVHEIAKTLRPGERLTGKPGRIVAEHEDVEKTVFRRQVVIGTRGRGPGRPADHPLGEHPGGRYVTPNKRETQELIAQPQAKSAPSFAAAVAAAKAGKREPPSPFHATGRYEGMFKSGARGHTQYMTIRTITQHSQWWIPARRGAFVAKKVADVTDPIIRGMFEDAFVKDVEAAMMKALKGGGT